MSPLRTHIESYECSVTSLGVRGEREVNRGGTVTCPQASRRRRMHLDRDDPGLRVLDRDVQYGEFAGRE